MPLDHVAYLSLGVINIELVNLLTIAVAEKAIYSTIRERIKDLLGVAARPNYQFTTAQFRPRTYRFTLIAPGRGKITELPLSEELPLPPTKVIQFTIHPDKLKTAELANGNRPLKLAQLYVRVQGEMKVRLEQTQVIAQVDYLRGALVEMQKSLATIKNSNGKAPEVLVEIPDGGSVKSLANILQFAQKSLSVTISSRSGADTGPILRLVQSELNALIDREKIQIRDDNKRVAFLLDNQLAITSTVGEIKRLASLDENERKAMLKLASEDYVARRNGKASDYGGGVGYGWIRLSGGYDSLTQEINEQTTKRRVNASNSRGNLEAR